MKKSNQIFISNDLYEKAKNISNKKDQTAIIFGDKVLSIDNTLLTAFKKEFDNDFLKYENILIAKDNVSENLQIMSNLLLNKNVYNKN